MNSRMKPCKFFLQGSCRNGSNCRFSHDCYRDNGARNHGNSENFGSQTPSPFGPHNGNTSASSTPGVAMTESGRALAIEELKNSPMWLLSGFAVAKGLPSVVTGDVSPEEARWEAYQELKTLGNCMQSTQRLQALAAEQQTQRQHVISLLENYQSAQRLFAGEALLKATGLGTQSSIANPFIQGGAASPFTAATPAAASFGTANPFTGGSTSTRSPFAGTSTTNNRATSSFNGGVSTTFGAPSSLGTTNGSNFSSAASSNPFGGGIASTASEFGKPAPTAMSPFRAPSATTFGGMATSSTPLGGPSMTTSPFGGSTSSTTAFGSGNSQAGYGHGNPLASPFGGSATTSASSPFSSALTNPISSPFGAPSSSPFNSTTATTFGKSSKSFGSSSTPASASTLFNTDASVLNVAPSSSPFGVQTAPASPFSGFGGTKKPAASSTAFFEKPVNTPLIQLPALENTGLSPDLRDDAWNMEQFQQAEFTFGNVPTMPPPPQFC